MAESVSSTVPYVRSIITPGGPLKRNGKKRIWFFMFRFVYTSNKPNGNEAHKLETSPLKLSTAWACSMSERHGSKLNFIGWCPHSPAASRHLWSLWPQHPNRVRAPTRINLQCIASWNILWVARDSCYSGSCDTHVGWVLKRNNLSSSIYCRSYL